MSRDPGAVGDFLVDKGSLGEEALADDCWVVETVEGGAGGAGLEERNSESGKTKEGRSREGVAAILSRVES